MGLAWVRPEPVKSAPFRTSSRSVRATALREATRLAVKSPVFKTAGSSLLASAGSEARVHLGAYRAQCGER